MNLEFELKQKENFRNVKVEITFLPISPDINSFKLHININNKYFLVDFGDYFIPYYIGTGLYGSEVLMKETYFQKYKEHENRIKKEYLNTFVRSSNMNKTCFYGYFENLPKLNRVYNQKLKPYILEKFLPYERITDEKLIITVKNLRFN